MKNQLSFAEVLAKSDEALRNIIDTFNFAFMAKGYTLEVHVMRYFQGEGFDDDILIAATISTPGRCSKDKRLQYYSDNVIGLNANAEEGRNEMREWLLNQLMSLPSLVD